MHLRIRHRTEYRYAMPPALALQRIRLQPNSDAYTRIEAWEVRVEGTERQGAFRDGFGNHTEIHALAPGSDRIVIEAAGSVHTRMETGIVSGPQPSGLWLYRRATALTAPTGGISELARGCDGSVAALHALSARVRERIDYRIGATGSTTTAAEALALGAGVCQDHAHAFIAAARMAGVPARYVSGYLRMDDRVEQDATHAWAEAHVPNLGWVGFDISNGISPDERYLPVARGLDYRDAAPVTGIVRAPPGTETLRVSLSVETLEGATPSQSQTQQ